MHEVSDGGEFCDILSLCCYNWRRGWLDGDRPLVSKAGTIEFPVLKTSESVGDVLLSEELTSRQTQEVKRLLGNYSDVLTDSLVYWPLLQQDRPNQSVLLDTNGWRE